MDRPEPGLVKWSPNASHHSFIHINLQHRVVQLYEPTGHAQRGRFDAKKLAKHDDFPPLTTYDWSPSNPSLLAVGTTNGIVNLLRIDDNSNAYLELGLKMLRTCQAVAFSTEGKLAVGLDRVRSDNCLYIWDVNRLSSMDSSVKGFPTSTAPFNEPTNRLEPSVSVSSVRFFEDNPNVLVAGIKGQGLRIHDLRDHGHGPSFHFQTKCCNNLAIDYADQNYFASSALDQPAIRIWDRRATQRDLASTSYLNAVDQEELTWGGALKLHGALETELDPTMVDTKNSFIRQMRFNRSHPGMLAVLSRAGQLKILSTKREYTEPELQLDGSPELLEVRRGYEADPRFVDSMRRNDKVVSFDWVTMPSAALKPRLLVLRANGAFEVLEKPSFTSEYPFKLIPWQSPYRGLEEGSGYHEPIELELSQSVSLLGPLRTEEALSDLSLFGPGKLDVASLVENSLDMFHMMHLNGSMQDESLPKTVSEAKSVAEKLIALRRHYETLPSTDQELATLQAEEPPSQRESHEKLLSNTFQIGSSSNKVQGILDHIMLLRAKERYLFDYTLNQEIVADDPWLRDVWAWVAGAEEAAMEGGVMSHPLDLSYMGVYTVWTNNLGSKPLQRLSDGSAIPDRNGWEHCLAGICKKLGIPKFDGVETKWPHHRQLCLDMCNWARSESHEFEESRSSVSSLKRDSSWYTRSAAHALFKGETGEAVQILKNASTEHPGLLFVSLALQLIGRRDESKESLDFDVRVASKTDPYLRAISSLIATGDWATITNQRSLPLRDRVFVAVRTFTDDALTVWLEEEVTAAAKTGDIEGIVLTGITDPLVDILARYVQKFNDVQTATLLLSICAPRFIDDFRTTAFRSAYRAYLQRHHAFFLRAKFDVESTRRSKHHGRPTLRPPARQIALRCVYCDAETSLQQYQTSSNPASFPFPAIAGSNPSSIGTASGSSAANGATSPLPGPVVGRGAEPQSNPFTEKMVGTGVSCPNCKRHLPRCVVCLEVVGMPRSDKPEHSSDAEVRLAARFPTFCLKCEHVLHLDHARQWFARHQECPVPECRCRCNFRANPELNYH
ncbi:hypothetical protein GQ53DRAFT_834188 [Thozetella sp. PMI_491]|nr:hypothetical protein GQ53DRAFT_834188 [Thozetella sp. PMI_491]